MAAGKGDGAGDPLYNHERPHQSLDYLKPTEVLLLESLCCCCWSFHLIYAFVFLTSRANNIHYKPLPRTVNGAAAMSVAGRHILGKPCDDV